MEQKEKDNQVSIDNILWKHYQVDDDSNFIQSHIRQDHLLNIVSRLKRFGRILEIGFGDGYLIKAISSLKGYECYGGDISEEHVLDMQGRIPGARFSVIHEGGAFPFPENYFDIFIASEVLEHMTNSQLDICLSEVSRVLKQKGYAIITFPAEEDMEKNKCFCPGCGLVFHKWGHKQSWDMKKIRKIFSSFEIISVKEYFNRFVGSSIFERVFGFIVWLLQTIVNYFWKFPARLFTNRSYVVILRKR